MDEERSLARCPHRVNRVTLKARRELSLLTDHRTQPTGCVRSGKGQIQTRKDNRMVAELIGL